MSRWTCLIIDQLRLIKPQQEQGKTFFRAPSNDSLLGCMNPWIFQRALDTGVPRRYESIKLSIASAPGQISDSGWGWMMWKVAQNLMHRNGESVRVLFLRASICAAVMACVGCGTQHPSDT